MFHESMERWKSATVPEFGDYSRQCGQDLNTHRLTESDFRFDVMRQWRHFTQNTAATWRVNTKRLFFWPMQQRTPVPDLLYIRSCFLVQRMDRGFVAVGSAGVQHASNSSGSGGTPGGTWSSSAAASGAWDRHLSSPSRALYTMLRSDLFAVSFRLSPPSSSSSTSCYDVHRLIVVIVVIDIVILPLTEVQNPLSTFPRNFPVNGEVAKVVVMEFGKRHNTTDTTRGSPWDSTAFLFGEAKWHCLPVARWVEENSIVLPSGEWIRL